MIRVSSRWWTTQRHLSNEAVLAKTAKLPVINLIYHFFMWKAHFHIFIESGIHRPLTDVIVFPFDNFLKNLIDNYLSLVDFVALDVHLCHIPLKRLRQFHSDWNDVLAHYYNAFLLSSGLMLFENCRLANFGRVFLKSRFDLVIHYKVELTIA